MTQGGRLRIIKQLRMWKIHTQKTEYLYKIILESILYGKNDFCFFIYSTVRKKNMILKSLLFWDFLKKIKN